MNEQILHRQSEALANMMSADSRRIDGLVETVGVIKGDAQAIKGRVEGISSGVDELRSALAVLVRHDVQMEHNRTATDTLAASVAKLDERVDKVEREIPPLIEMRSWAIKAMLAVIAVVGLAVVGLVVFKGGIGGMIR